MATSRIFKPPRPKFIIVTATKLIWIILLLLLAVGLIAVYRSHLFTITGFLCRFNDRPCSEPIEAELDKLKGKNILLFKPTDLEAKLKIADLRVGSVTVIPRLPHTVEVILSHRESAISVGVATTSAHMIVDDQNVVFSITESPTSPPLIISPAAAALRIGDNINTAELLAAINLSRALRDHFVAFVNIHTETQLLKVRLDTGQTALFDPLGNPQLTVPSLQRILREATIEPQPKEIDLRFDKPVLRF